MAVEVPLVATPNQELAIELEDQDCTIQVRQIGDYIYLTLWVDADLIVENAICIPVTPIIQGSVRNFTGNLMMIDTSADINTQNMPDYNQLGERYKLVYLTDEEIKEYVTD